MLIKAFIPGFRKVKESDHAFTVFTVEVWNSGQKNILEKRYSEFEELHKQLKKIVVTPDFPPKKVMKWNAKVLEQRRLALQTYLQSFLDRDSIPKSLLRFLEVNIYTGSMESLDRLIDNNTETHQPLISFSFDAFLNENSKSTLPDIVVEGVTMGLYAPLENFLPG
ncbi:hypothetical protein SNE40_011635 [Patella caerulea]|uniref:PX domain-containing protein n=2 Tax=Patella TaxID=6463 RepID=A0AAN8JN49_PATCE